MTNTGLWGGPQSPAQPTTPYTPPPTYMASAVLGLLSGPWPLGVVAIYQAAHARNPKDWREARIHSEKARNWSRATLVLSFVIVSPGILAIAYNLATGVDGDEVGSTIFGLVVLCAMLAAAGVGLILAAERRGLTAIIVGVVGLAVAVSSVGLYMLTGPQSYHFAGRAIVLGGGDDDVWDLVAVGTDATVAVLGQFDSRNGDFPNTNTYSGGITAFIGTDGKVLSYDVRSATGIVAAPDGGFVAATYHSIIKYTAAGQTQWESELTYRSVQAVAVADDGSIMTLSTDLFDTSVSLQKLASDGTHVWAKDDKWPLESQGLYFSTTPDGGCVAFGQMRNDAVLLIGYDINGERAWTQQFDTSMFPHTIGLSVAPDGEILALYRGFHGPQLVSVNEDGSVNWTTNLPNDSLNAMALTASGEIVAVGVVRIDKNDQSAIIRYGADGERGTVTPIGDSPQITLNAVAVSADAGIIAVGSTDVHRGPARRTHLVEDALIIMA